VIIKTSYELINFLEKYPDVNVLVHASGYPNVEYNEWADNPFISVVGNNGNENEYTKIIPSEIRFKKKAKEDKMCKVSAEDVPFHRTQEHKENVTITMPLADYETLCATIELQEIALRKDTTPTEK